MHVILSGRAGVALIEFGDNLSVVTVSEAPKPCGESFARQIFWGADDLKEYDFQTIGEIQHELEYVHACDQAQTLLLMILDKLEDPSLRNEASSVLNEILGDSLLQTWINNRILRVDWREADLDGAYASSNGHPNTTSVINYVERVQSAALLCKSALVAAMENLQIAPTASAILSQHIHVVGLWPLAVNSFLNVGVVDEAKFLAHKELSGYSQYRALISQWLPASDHRAQKVNADAKSDEYSSVKWHRRLASPSPNRKTIFQNVMQQQGAIRELLQKNHLTRAIEYTEDLVDYQLGTPRGKIYVVKTLCSLAQEARRLELYSIQLEWVLFAIRVGEPDGWAYGQLGDAYIMNRRLSEAQGAFHRAAEVGEALYAVTGGARILRAQGRFDEALTQFRKAKSLPASSDDAVYAWIGEAEVLRELEFAEDALAVYADAVQKFPTEVMVRCGLAAVLSELGRQKESLDYYDEVLRLFHDDSFALCGKGNTLKNVGEFDNALELFEKTTEIYPTISYGFCGRADVFRLRGDLDNAIDAFQKARTQFPTMSAPIAGLAEAFRDAHRFSDAIDAYNYAAREFPFDSWCRNGRANVLRTTWQLPDALAAYDQILLDLPSNIGAATGRANVLKLLRQYPSSLEAYDLILARRPNHKQARYGRAAVLALLGRSEEALSILPASAAMAQARVDWFGLHTRSMLLLKLHRVDEALDLLENAVLKIPFYKYREMFERALGLARLKATLYEAAVNILRAARDPVGKIINIHALCTMGRTAEAREVYRAVKAEHADVAVELRKAVGALCGVEPSGPTLTGQQIFEFECEAILQEVAA